MKICKRFKGIFLFTLVLILAACSSTTTGEGASESSDGEGSGYPNKEIKIIVHTSPGGPTDTMVRKLATEAEPILGQSIIVENKKGGSGAAQMAALQSGDSEGYTLASITPTHVGAWNSNLKGQFSPEDFAFVTRVQLDPYILAVNADSEFKTLGDLVDYMKAHPGEIKVGGYGAVGSGHNVAWNIFADTAGVEGTWTNYGSTSDAVTALLGNHVDVANSNPGKVMQYVESGELRVLGVFNEERLESLPEVPTYEEAGFDANVDWAQFRGIYTNGDVPEEVLQKLSEAFEEAMNTDEFKKFLKESKTEYGYMDYKEFTDFINKQMEVNNDWLNKLGIK
ncbi:tripartite tricarboxylate transporter substrate binding protein [Halobacillus amylolyticus]|uniref:Tripartite tricarboxylate transporter substrate binding protein n=1 Tax=Halobacillus amylolyticus TaxID=2932259 RepID=A0ABY4HFY1_9BACI|nr:tripartite tricarboxylate transporter substrate binding protein [Halobacillus amylolyticus]UOR13701.1 tripartite tricarboxylate transporter substrate binding protein [Halobacillus amylolyticus]